MEHPKSELGIHLHISGCVTPTYEKKNAKEDGSSNVQQKLFRLLKGNNKKVKVRTT